MRIATAALLLVTACATTPEAPPKEFVAEGEIRLSLGGRSASASFSDDRVVSPAMDVSKRGDGSWRGRAGNTVIDVNVYPNRCAGSGIILTQEEKDGATVYTGQIEGKILRFELRSDQMLIRTPKLNETLNKNPDGTYGPNGILSFTGDATKTPPEWPQFAFALVAAFAN